MKRAELLQEIDKQKYVLDEEKKQLKPKNKVFRQKIIKLNN